MKELFTDITLRNGEVKKIKVELEDELAEWLVTQPEEVHSPFFKINILPLQTGDLATSGTRINSGGNNGVNMDRFKLSHFENFGNLFVAESLNLRSYDFGYLQAAGVSRIGIDIFLLPCHCHDGLKNG